jgi:hypothetical protein
MDDEEEGLHEVSIMKTSQNQDIRHSPNQYQIEVQGVCAVTENLIKETLAMYNGDAIDWIMLHIGGESRVHKDTARNISSFFQLAAGAHSSFC